MKENVLCSLRFPLVMMLLKIATSFYGEVNVYFRESVPQPKSRAVEALESLCEYRVNQLENETPIHDPIITQNQSRIASKTFCCLRN